ncbi:MAG TPA: ABC transporter ATP-binding protein, partial [archaeon]|nr:ABC transporter ATP-binding protein [archaeon]
IEVQGVSKGFKAHGETIVALDDVSLSVKEGEIFGLLGPNGAGKTTLINALLNLVVPDSGSVRVLGKEVRKHPEVLEELNALSAQSAYAWVLTPRDVLEFFARSYNVPKAAAEKRIARLMEFFGLHAIARQPFISLSTGERMRLSLAKALINNPRLVLLDEPTLGLDPDIARKVRAEILRINKRFGTTVLLTSHYMQEVEQLCDRVAFINHGRIVDIGTAAELKKRLFETETLVVECDRIGNRQALRRLGFRVRGQQVERELRGTEDVLTLLAAVKRTGTRVLSVTTLKPTLEDYFVKVLREDAMPVEEG